MQFCNVLKMTGCKFIVNRNISDFFCSAFTSCKILNSCTNIFDKNEYVKLWKLLKLWNLLFIGNLFFFKNIAIIMILCPKIIVNCYRFGKCNIYRHYSRISHPTCCIVRVYPCGQICPSSLTAQVVNALSTLSALRQKMQLPFLLRSPLSSLFSAACHHLQLACLRFPAL